MKSNERRRKLCLVWLVLAIAPLLMAGSWIALKENANSINDWLPSEYQATLRYQWFQEHFGTDEFAMISWPGCSLDDPRIDRLSKILKPSDDDGGSAPSSRFHRVVSGPSIIRELMAPPVNLTREEAIDRLGGIFISPDHNLTCVLVELTPAARKDLHATMKVMESSIRQAGIPFDDIKMGGSPVVNAAVDDISIGSMFRAILLTCISSIIISWVCIRDWHLTVLILLTGIISMAASLAVLPLCGVHLNATLFTMVPMVQTAAVSGAIHLCNYFRQAVREGGLDGAAERAVRHAVIPLSLAAGTTAAGLLSICYSDLQPIQQFGLFSAIGIGLSWLMLIYWLPAALSLWYVDGNGQANNVSHSTGTGEAPLSKTWQLVANTVLGHHRWMAGLCFLVLLICSPGLLWFKVSIDLLRELPDESDAITDMNWLEENLCKLTTVEVILRVPEGSPLSIWERLRLAKRVEDRLSGLEHVGGVMSAASFIPEFKARDLTLLRRPAINRQLEKQRPEFLKSRFLAESDGEELWRVAVRVAALSDLDVAEFTDQLKAETSQELQSERFAGITTVETGVGHAIHTARRSLVDGLLWGLFTDVLLIYVAVLILMRSWSGGLVMIVSSVFPTCIVLGIAGWLDLEIYVGTILAPCVALGVTVDDVIHFMIWFRNGVRQGQSQYDALQLAWRACARPMYQSWFLLGVAMVTLLWCDLTSIRQFGATMAAMLTAGLVGNLVLVPAILAGRLGRLICPSVQTETKSLEAVPESA
jgi:predicted RND superfamily exporter protein